MFVHKHRFADVTDANAFVCGINWVKNSLQGGDLGSVDDLEVQDILVGEEFGHLVATVVVLEDNDVDEQEGEDIDLDHREHV